MATRSAKMIAASKFGAILKQVREDAAPADDEVEECEVTKQQSAVAKANWAKAAGAAEAAAIVKAWGADELDAGCASIQAEVAACETEYEATKGGGFSLKTAGLAITAISKMTPEGEDDDDDDDDEDDVAPATKLVGILGALEFADKLGLDKAALEGQKASCEKEVEAAKAKEAALASAKEKLGRAQGKLRLVLALKEADDDDEKEALCEAEVGEASKWKSAADKLKLITTTRKEKESKWKKAAGQGSEDLDEGPRCARGDRLGAGGGGGGEGERGGGLRRGSISG